MADQTLEAARDFNGHHDECGCGPCHALASLLERHAAGAIEAARPEIERRAKVEALKLARSLYEPHTQADGIGQIYARGLQRVEAEITKLSKEE